MTATKIRSEKPEDVQAIRHVHEQAFSGPVEAEIVERLRRANRAPVSLVAERGGRIVGHILFSPVTVTPSKPGVNGAGLAPMAVLPEFQRQGIGSSLIRAGLNECRKLGFDFVVVLGDPRYYPRFGFSRAKDCGLGNEYGVDEEFMVMELAQGALAGTGGMVQYGPEFKEAGC